MTRFEKGKQLVRVEGECVLPGLEGARVRGYEIHQGRTIADPHVRPAFCVAQEGTCETPQPEGAAEDPSIAGTYIHGLFDHSDFRTRYLNRLRVRKGLPELPPHGYDTRPKGFDELADLLRDHLDLERVSEIAGIPLRKATRSFP